ncbi:MAG: hypothetical protein U1E23_09330 [Reyranellaceae bacterium]
MSDLSVAEAAVLDLQREAIAMAKRASIFSKPDPTVEEITDYDRRRFGQAVRLSIDVCVPLPDLKRDLVTIRAEIGNCLAILEQSGSGNERRKLVHSRLGDLRAELFYRRRERKGPKTPQET